MLQLYGDGLRDDTAAIQQLLDTRTAEVYLPAPQNCYLISRTLKLHPGQTLRMAPTARIRLADDSNCARLENGDFEFITMMANLIYLPKVQTIQMKMPELTMEQIGELRAAYENIAVSCTVEILGQEYDSQVEELDLQHLTSEQVAEVAEKLSMLSGVSYVELCKEDGTSNLTKEDVLALKKALPDATFHYVFDFYGEKIDTTADKVHIKLKNIGDAGIDDLRMALSLTENCDRFLVEYCRISYDLLAQVREEFNITASDGYDCPIGPEVVPVIG